MGIPRQWSDGCLIYSSIEVILLFLLLLPHQNASKNAKGASGLSSHSLSHTPIFSQAPLPAPPPHVRKKLCVYLCILGRSAHRRLCGFVGMAWFRSSCQCHQQSIIKQAGARCLPSSEPSGCVASSLLSGSLPQCESFVDPRPRDPRQQPNQRGGGGETCSTRLN